MTALSVDTLGQHINGDEAMSFGASYIAANMSASFVVRDLYLIEQIPHDVRLKIDGVDYDEVIFFKGDPVGSSKVMVFNATQDLTLTVSHEDVTTLVTKLEGINSIIESEQFKTNGTDPVVEFTIQYS